MFLACFDPSPNYRSVWLLSDNNCHQTGLRKLNKKPQTTLNSVILHISVQKQSLLLFWKEIWMTPVLHIPTCFLSSDNYGLALAFLNTALHKFWSWRCCLCAAYKWNRQRSTSLLNVPSLIWPQQPRYKTRITLEKSMLCFAAAWQTLILNTKSLKKSYQIYTENILIL